MAWIACSQYLDGAGVVLEAEESQLAHHAPSHDAAGHRDILNVSGLLQASPTPAHADGRCLECNNDDPQGVVARLARR